MHRTPLCHLWIPVATGIHRPDIDQISLPWRTMDIASHLRLMADLVWVFDELSISLLSPAPGRCFPEVSALVGENHCPPRGRGRWRRREAQHKRHAPTRPAANERRRSDTQHQATSLIDELAWSAPRSHRA